MWTNADYGAVALALQAAQTVDRVLGDFTVLGLVSEFNHEAGFGFFVATLDLPWPQQLPAGSPIFVAADDLMMAEGTDYSALKAGMEVEFRVFLSDKGVQAAEVTLPDGSPIGTRPKGYGKGKGAPSLSWAVPGNGGKGGKGNSWQNWQGPPVQKEIHKPHTDRGTVKAALEAWSRATGLPVGNQSAVPGSGGLSSALAGIQTASMDLINDESFQRASPEEQAASLSIMQEAMAQAEMAQVAMEQAQAMVRGGGKTQQEEQFALTFGGSEESLQNAALAQAIVQMQGAQGAKKVKQVPCRFFAEGRCKNGDNCEFSHDSEMYRPKTLDEKNPSLCNFYDQGKCSRGAACPFAHGNEELAAIQLVKGGGKGGY